MERTLDVPVFRVSRTIVTDKFDALYKARTCTRTRVYVHACVHPSVCGC